MTTKQLYKHTDTGEIYAIESSWDGQIVSSCGPVVVPLKDLDSYEYTSEHNQWIQDNNDKFVLM